MHVLSHPFQTASTCRCAADCGHWVSLPARPHTPSLSPTPQDVVALASQLPIISQGVRDAFWMERLHVALLARWVQIPGQGEVGRDGQGVYGVETSTMELE